MATVAVLPVKSFAGAKQRLAGELPAEARRLLAEAMVADVLGALAAVRRLDATVVVTREAAAQAIAREHAVDVLDDPAEAGQSAAATRGVAWALERGAERVVLVPGDCPLLDPGELDGLLEDSERSGPGVTIVPDRHGEGTNALVLAPPDAIVPGFGPRSRERHVVRAREAGVRCTVAQVGSLSLDVDAPEDLAALRRALGASSDGAARTREALGRLPALECAP